DEEHEPGRPDLQHVPEGERVDRDHHEGVDERPEEAEHRPAVFELQVLEHELSEQGAIADERRERRRQRVERLGAVDHHRGYDFIPMSLRGSAILIALFFAAMQLFVLPPDGFTTGDQGSKYLQTRAFAEYGPINANIDIAARDIDPSVRRQEPKLKLRRG